MMRVKKTLAKNLLIHRGMTFETDHHRPDSSRTARLAIVALLSSMEDIDSGL
jgi:hypothetical protein